MERLHASEEKADPWHGSNVEKKRFCAHERGAAATLMAAVAATGTVKLEQTPHLVDVRRKRGRPPGSKNKPKKHSVPVFKKRRVCIVNAADIGVGGEDEYVQVPLSLSRRRRHSVAQSLPIRKPRKKTSDKRALIRPEQCQQNSAAGSCGDDVAKQVALPLLAFLSTLTGGLVAGIRSRV